MAPVRTEKLSKAMKMRDTPRIFPKIKREIKSESLDRVPCEVAGQVPQSKKKMKSEPQERASCEVAGQVIYPTVVFDTFFRWCAKRNAMEEARRAGAPWPWTQDKTLQEYRFTNVFRICDKGSQFVVSEVIEKGSQEPIDVVFRILLYQTFCKPETYQALEEQFRPLTHANYNRKSFLAALKAIKTKNGAVYTSAFQKPAPMDFSCSKSDTASWEKHLMLLEMFFERGIVEVLANAKYMAEVYEFIASFPAMGDFASHQLLIVFSYSSLLNFNANDFVVAGCGAKSGLQKIFGKDALAMAMKKDPSFDVHLMRWIVETAPMHFARLNLTFNGLGPDHLPMTLHDVEHALCEVDKYARAVHPTVKGGNRTQLTNKYHAPSTEEKEEKKSKAHGLPIIPKAWSNPARQHLRIRPGGPPVVVKEYLVEKITGHKIEKGKSYFKVRWKCYSAEFDTWEPVAGLQDAKLCVNDFLNEKGLSPLEDQDFD